jgi:hypothetical protein
MSITRRNAIIGAAACAVGPVPAMAGTSHRDKYGKLWEEGPYASPARQELAEILLAVPGVARVATTSPNQETNACGIRCTTEAGRDWYTGCLQFKDEAPRPQEALWEELRDTTAMDVVIRGDSAETLLCEATGEQNRALIDASNLNWEAKKWPIEALEASMLERLRATPGVRYARAPRTEHLGRRADFVHVCMSDGWHLEWDKDTKPFWPTRERLLRRVLTTGPYEIQRFTERRRAIKARSRTHQRNVVTRESL